MSEDKILVCRECGNEFIFTAGEQDFFNERGLLNEPQRCPGCRGMRRRADRGKKEMFEVVCAGCGTLTKVPFEPRPERAVYCTECYRGRRRARRV